MKRRILYTIAGLHPESGGPSRSVPALAESVAQAGGEAQLVTLHFGDAYGPPMMPAAGPVRAHLIPCDGFLSRRTRYTPLFQRELEHRCRAAEVEVIHDTGVWLPTNHTAAAVARKFRLPLVISPRGMLMDWSLTHRLWKKKFAWSLFQRRDLESAALLHATSMQEAEDLRALGMRQPIAVLANGVNIPEHSLTNAPQSESRKANTVLFLSRIHPKKGIFDLLEAWERLEPDGWQLRIVGGGEARHCRDVAQWIATRRLEKSVTLAGPVDDLGKWSEYAAADIFILPSHSENFGIVVAEALAAGVPVITTRATPWSELIERRCGWWIETGSAAVERALGEAMLLTCGDRVSMGARGRALVEEKYSWSRIGEQMLQVYEWIAGSGPMPAHVLQG